MDEEIKKKFAAMEARIDELETKVIEDCKFGCEGRLICAYKQAGILGIIEEVSTILAELPLKEPQ